MFLVQRGWLRLRRWASAGSGVHCRPALRHCRSEIFLVLIPPLPISTLPAGSGATCYRSLVCHFPALSNRTSLAHSSTGRRIEVRVG